MPRSSKKGRTSKTAAEPGSKRAVRDLQGDIQNAQEEQERLVAELAALGVAVNDKDSASMQARVVTTEKHISTSRAISANATKRSAVDMKCSDDDSSRGQVGSTPSGACASSTHDSDSKTTHITAYSAQKQGSCKQSARPRVDKASDIPTRQQSITEIPKRKQQDPIEMAIIQVMDEHGLQAMPTGKANRSMFDALVQIKTQKLIQSRMNRVKRRENRKKKHTDT